MAAAVPVVSVVGKSDSGKTGVMEGLIRALTERGFRVGTVKHHVHDVDLDVPGKDSWRHQRAGAVVAMISSPTQLGVFRKLERERTLDELLAEAGDVDVMLTEGFQRAGTVRIEVSRKARSEELINDPRDLFALVTDAEVDAGETPVFGLDGTGALAELIVRTFLARAEG